MPLKIEVEGILVGLAELNERAELWLETRVHQDPSCTTTEKLSDRLGRERSFLTRLPSMRFDTDYVETRRVHNVFPFVVINGVRYSVQPNILDQLVEVRRAVDSPSFEIRLAGTTVASHCLATEGVREVWDSAQLTAERLRTRHSGSPAGRIYRIVEGEPGAAAAPSRLDLGRRLRRRRS